MMFKQTISLFMIFIGMILTGVVYTNVALSHQDPIAPVILSVTGILFFALLGRYPAQRLEQPLLRWNISCHPLLNNNDMP